MTPCFDKVRGRLRTMRFVVLEGHRTAPVAPCSAPVNARRTKLL